MSEFRTFFVPNAQERDEVVYEALAKFASRPHYRWISGVGR